MFNRKRDMVALAAFVYGPYLLGVGAAFGGAWLLARQLQPEVPDQSVTIRMSAEDLAKIRSGAVTDGDLGEAFREAVKNSNSPMPPKLELPKGGPSGPAPRRPQ